MNERLKYVVDDIHGYIFECPICPKCNVKAWESVDLNSYSRYFECPICKMKEPLSSDGLNYVTGEMTAYLEEINKEKVDSMDDSSHAGNSKAESENNIQDPISEILSMLDGASIAVELFNAETPAQKKWKEEWLSKFRNIMKAHMERKPDGRPDNSDENFSYKG